jgi:hypothetical protein
MIREDHRNLSGNSTLHVNFVDHAICGSAATIAVPTAFVRVTVSDVFGIRTFFVFF